VSEDFDVQAFARDIHQLIVLSTLQGGPRHGYQIALDVERDSNGLVHFKHGTLYPILHRLEEDGLIRGSWREEGGRRRKVYALTGAGRRHLSGGTTRLDEVLSRLMHLLRQPGRAKA
jgi:PadR family transcriptional regulator